MFKIIILFSLLTSTVTLAFDIEKILSQPREKITQIERIESDRVTFISSDFAQAQIQTIGLRSKISKLEITKIYYVYTSYKLNPKFSQLNLDRERFKTLNDRYPEALINDNIEWNIIEQTGLLDYTNGKRFFHGFILVHRPLRTEESREKELDYVFGFLDGSSQFIPEVVLDPIAELFKKDEDYSLPIEVKGEDRESAEFNGGDQNLMDHIQTNFKTPNDVWKDRKDFWASYNVVINSKGKVNKVIFLENYSTSVQREIEALMLKSPDWSPKIIDGKPLSDTVNFELRVSYSSQVKGMFTIDGRPPTLSHKLGKSKGSDRGNEIFIQENIRSSKVFKSLDQIESSKKIAIVIDVTGSMHQNIISTTYWIKVNENQLPFSSFTAFNDGDKTPDNEKVIGATKGIYFTKFFSEYNETIKNAMRNGSGGDFPENDIEAILHAIRNDPLAEEILLIADNMSDVKDIKLLDKVNKPVSILPCSLTKLIHYHYLDLVRKTGGKIYYNGQAIDISKLKKGDSFKLKSVRYTFNGRQFTTSA